MLPGYRRVALPALVLAGAALLGCAALWMGDTSSNDSSASFLRVQVGRKRRDAACSALWADTAFSHAGSTLPQLMETYDAITAHYLYYQGRTLECDASAPSAFVKSLVDGTAGAPHSLRGRTSLHVWGPQQLQQGYRVEPDGSVSLSPTECQRVRSAGVADDAVMLELRVDFFHDAELAWPATVFSAGILMVYASVRLFDSAGVFGNATTPVVTAEHLLAFDGRHSNRYTACVPLPPVVGEYSVRFVVEGAAPPCRSGGFNVSATVSGSSWGRCRPDADAVDPAIVGNPLRSGRAEDCRVLCPWDNLNPVPRPEYADVTLLPSTLAVNVTRAGHLRWRSIRHTEPDDRDADAAPPFDWASLNLKHAAASSGVARATTAVPGVTTAGAAPGSNGAPAWPWSVTGVPWSQLPRCTRCSDTACVHARRWRAGAGSQSSSGSSLRASGRRAGVGGGGSSPSCCVDVSGEAPGYWVLADFVCAVDPGTCAVFRDHSRYLNGSHFWLPSSCMYRVFRPSEAFNCLSAYPGVVVSGDSLQRLLLTHIAAFVGNRTDDTPEFVSIMDKVQGEMNVTVRRQGPDFANDVSPVASPDAKVRLFLNFNSGVSLWRMPQLHTHSAWANTTFRWGVGRYPAGSLMLLSPSKWEVYARPHTYAANLQRIVDGAADIFPGPVVFIATETYTEARSPYFLWQQTQRAVMRAEQRLVAKLDTNLFTMSVRGSAWDGTHFGGLQVLLKMNLLLNSVCPALVPPSEVADDDTSSQ